jgi:pyruvate carboxylase
VLRVAEGSHPESGQAFATIDAMKMAASITSPVDGTEARLAISGTAQAEAGGLPARARPGVALN